MDAGACPHPLADTRTCERCGFRYCRACSEDVGCPRCRMQAFAAQAQRYHRRLVGALWVSLAAIVAGGLILLDFILSHPAGVVLGLLIAYGVLCLYWLVANWDRVRDSLDMTERGEGAMWGCMSLFPPFYVLILIPALAYTPFDIAQARRKLREAQQSRSAIADRLRG